VTKNFVARLRGMPLDRKLWLCGAGVAVSATVALVSLVLVGAFAGKAGWGWVVLFCYAILQVRFLHRRSKGLDANLANFLIRADMTEAERAGRDQLVIYLTLPLIIFYFALPLLWVLYS
jgi:hypothetical protein